MLCYDQHRVIDNATMWDVYDVDMLRRIKREHEHRIRQLTALRDEDRTTVLRVVGAIRGAGVTVNPQTVAATLLADSRYPDYSLIGIDELEVDLRHLPGEAESAEVYWSTGVAMIQERLRLLRARIDRESVRHISVFAFARIPLLIALGAELDDTTPAQIYAKRRGHGEGWGWVPDALTVDFEYVTRRGGTDPHQVAVMFSVSGSIDIARLPASVDASTTVYEVRPIGVTPGPEIISSPGSLENFTRTWRDLLSHIEVDHPGIEEIDVLPAVPVTAAVTIGRTPMRNVHPTLRVHDRVSDGGYNFTLAVTP
uniref:SAVED domain-containing protein n=1 Tax=Rhodococcus oryzae TaxID=2571143 RepID=UPI00145E25F2|nr:SAVED domain-containing protein [Rhodococcus oryzae]